MRAPQRRARVGRRTHSGCSPEPDRFARFTIAASRCPAGRKRSAILRPTTARHRRHDCRAASVVTGAAGFIGSHLCEALVARGVDVIGVDCFTDYYDPALKRRNVGPLGPGRASRCSSSTSRRRHLAGAAGAAPSSTRRRSPACAPRGARSSRLRAPQRARHPAPARALQGHGLERVVVASSSSVYGDAESAADRRGRPAAPVLALRRDQARGRAPRAALRARTSGCRPWRCATSRCTVRASAPTWGSTASSRRARGQADRGLRRRRADARLHVHRRRGRGEPRGRRARRWRPAPS